MPISEPHVCPISRFYDQGGRLFFYQGRVSKKMFRNALIKDVSQQKLLLIYTRRLKTVNSNDGKSKKKSFGLRWQNNLQLYSIQKRRRKWKIWFQVVASIHKQDSSDCAKDEEGKEDSVTTECYIGHVTHFRNDSFR